MLVMCIVCLLQIVCYFCFDYPPTPHRPRCPSPALVDDKNTDGENTLEIDLVVDDHDDDGI